MSVIESVTVISADGRITLPDEIRTALDLRAGDEIVLSLGGSAVKWVSLRSKRTEQPTRSGAPDAQDFHRIFADEVVDEYVEEMKRIERAKA